uniref:Integrase catalytic domain-containing protein n=1 Tax=Amphilophus citrinellus TaxID=61819 RepID=A0A3Q0SUC5_AMPCI
MCVRDNGPQYDCSEFHEFAKQNGFKHVTSSPLYAQAHGQAGKGVQIVKRLLKKARVSKADPYLALLSYRTTSLECGASPAELLMCCKLRTTLPHIPTHSDYKYNNKVPDKSTRLEHRQKMNYGKMARNPDPLQKEDDVQIEGPELWDRKATILKMHHSEPPPPSPVTVTLRQTVKERCGYLALLRIT